MRRGRTAASASPTELTLSYFRERAWEIGVVERFVGPLKIRLDFGGFADLIAYHHQGTLAVQACTTGDVPKRIRKILGEPQGPTPKDMVLAERARRNAFLWLMHKDRGIIVIGWKKYKRPDEEGRVVRPTIYEVTINDFI
jgi:hypothetical protein